MLNANKFYFIIILILEFFFQVSCNSKVENQMNEKYDIMFHLIDKHTLPILVPPPPPPNGIKDTLFMERELILDQLRSDEWKNQKQIIAIKTEFDEINHKDIPYHDTNIPSEYNFIFNKYLNDRSDEFINIKNIKSTRGNIFLEAPSIQNLKNNPKLWETFDLIVSFSDVKFNLEKTKAVVYMGISYGKLNGWSAYFLLEKRKKTWFVKYSNTFQIS